VDNDARIVELLTWFLSQRGFEVRTAGSFVEARERLAEGAPDLLVSDVDLGAESAVQELPRLRADGILPRTLVVSGYLDAAIKAALTALPEVVGTLAKPFEFTDLEAAIDRALWGEGAGEGASADPGDFEVPRPERAPAAPPEESQSGGGAAPDEDDDDDGWIEITPGS
jgi:DNA-binding response OmpR family regulator